jgi:hypothetical protein
MRELEFEEQATNERGFSTAFAVGKQKAKQPQWQSYLYSSYTRICRRKLKGNEPELHYTGMCLIDIQPFGDLGGKFHIQPFGD